MMEGVVDSGTAKNLKHADFKIAGKTGTAQVPKKDGRGYEVLFWVVFQTRISRDVVVRFQ